jgi:outer membrane receptor protein involved in Fe transport
LRADIGAWSADLRGNYGRQTEHRSILNRVNSARLAVALADTNPATAYNLFGDGPSTNPATIDFVRGSTRSSNSGAVWSTTLRADGPVFSLPAGNVRLAVEAITGRNATGRRNVQRHIHARTPDGGSHSASGPRRIRAFYAEALVPVFGGELVIRGFRRLDFSAAVRTERYSDFGSTTNPRLGLNWEPVRGLQLRGSYGTSFRAPGPDDCGRILERRCCSPSPFRTRRRRADNPTFSSRGATIPTCNPRKRPPGR